MKFKKFFLVIAVLTLGISVSFAQSIESLCTSLIDNSFSDMGTNCAGMAVNTACIGSNGVSAQFVSNNHSQFSDPADRISLSEISQIESSGINISSEVWGLSVINTYSNLPSGAPGEGVVMIAMGDVQITEATPEENLFTPDVSLTVTVEADSESASLLSYPPQWGTTESEEVAVVENGLELSADAVSEDGEWLRVFYISDHVEEAKRVSAWINADNIIELDTSSLPSINFESRTPMQSISVLNAEDDRLCDEQPESELFLQGPSPVEVQMTINGLDIGITSSAKFKVKKDGDRYTGRFTSVTGSLKIYDPRGHGRHSKSIIIKPGEIFDFPCIIDVITGLITADPDWLDDFDSHKSNHENQSRNGGHFGDYSVYQLFQLLKKIPNNVLWYAIKECIPERDRPSGVGNPNPDPHHGNCPKPDKDPYKCSGSSKNGIIREDCSSIQVTAQCSADTANFTVRNTGESGNGDMVKATEFRLYLDGVLIDSGQIQLDGGETLDPPITFQGEGKVELQVDQLDWHPGNSSPRADCELG